MQQARANSLMQVFLGCTLTLCVFFLTVPIALAQGGGPGGDWMQHPDPDNPFRGADDQRARWLPAAMPPTAEEIDKYPELLLEGNWTIEWSGHPDFGSARVWVTKGLRFGSECSLGRNYATCRNPDDPIVVRSIGATKSDGASAGHSANVQLSGDGTQFQVRHAGAESGAINSVLLRTADPDVLQGVWESNENRGTEVWRRDPRPTISATTCHHQGNDVRGDDSHPCNLTIKGYPPVGAMRGNAPSFAIDVIGENFYGAGPFPAFLDWDKTHLELHGFCYLYERKFSEDPRNNCASWAEPSEVYGDVIGVRLIIAITYGARPGTYAVWLGGTPVPFTLGLPDLPNLLRNDPTVNLEITATGTQSGLGRRSFLVRNHGPALADGIRFALSSEHRLCPYETGCEGPSNGLGHQLQVCPENTDNNCFTCALNPSLTREKSAQYECPMGRLHADEVAAVEMRFDPKPAEIPGQPVVHESERSCMTPQTVKVTVTSNQFDSDTSNIVAETVFRGEEPEITGLRYMRIVGANEDSRSYVETDVLYPGQPFVVEAPLDKPICGWDDGGEIDGHVSDDVHPADPFSVSAKLLLFSTKGRLRTELNSRSAGPHVLHTDDLTLESVLDISQVVPEAGDTLRASTDAFSTTARIGELENLATLKLTAYDLEGHESSARTLPPGAPFTAEMKFRDGQGPVPNQAQYVINIERAYCDIPEGLGDDSVPNDCGGLGAANTVRERLALRKVADGTYRSARTTYQDNRTMSVKGVSAYVEGESPLHKLTFSIPDGTADVSFAQLDRDGSFYTEVSGVNIDANMLVELSNIRSPRPLPRSLKATLMLREKGTVAASKTADIQIDTNQRVPEGHDDDAGVYSDYLYFGSAALFPDIQEGDEVRVSVPQVGAVSPWVPASYSRREVKAIQVLPVGDGVDVSSVYVQPNGEVVVRLTFEPGDSPQGRSVPVRFEYARRGDVLDGFTVSVSPHATAPHVFLSRVLAIFPDAVGGDKITAIYDQPSPLPKASASIEVASPPGTPDNIRFLVNGNPVDTIPAGSTAVIEVTLKSKLPEGKAIGKVRVNTGPAFRAAYHPSQNQQTDLSLTQSATDLLRYRTDPILLAGATPPANASTRYLDVLEGYTVSATLDSVISDIKIVNPASGKNAVFKVELTGGEGKKALARVLATNSVGGESYEFLTNATVQLPDGHYYITVELPLTFRTAEYLHGGKSRTFKIPAADTGSFLVEFDDSKTVAAAMIVVRLGAPLAKWGTSGAIIERLNEVVLPRGKYGITVEAGNKKHVFEDVEIRGGKTTKRTIP